MESERVNGSLKAHEREGDANEGNVEEAPREAGGDPSLAQVGTYSASSNRDNCNKPEVTASEADVEPMTENEETTQLRQQLEEAQAELAKPPEDDESISEKLCRVADCIINYHSSIGTSTEEPFLEALQIATQARDTPGADAFSQSLAMLVQMICCHSLYKVTKRLDWLHQSVAFGKESIVRTMEARIANPAETYSIRCKHLAEILEELYKAEDLLEHIADAVHFQGMCVDNTFHEDDDLDHSGDFVLYYRYKKWVTLCILFLDKKRDPVLDGFQALIDQISERMPCSLDEGDRPVAHVYWFTRFVLHCRQWAQFRTTAHLDGVRQRASELLEWEANDPFCTCHGNYDHPAMSTDPKDPLHVIRRAAGFFDGWFDLDNDDGQWSRHLPTIETSIALWEETMRGTSRSTFADLRRDLRPTMSLSERFRQKHLITQDPRDGWHADDRTWESSRIDSLVKAAGRKEYSSTALFVPLLGHAHLIIMGSSHVAPEIYFVHDSSDFEKPWNLDNQRFKFVKGEDPLTVNRWIRERSDDGKFILGGAQEGQDNDVLEFIANYDKPIVDESSSDQATNQLDNEV